MLSTMPSSMKDENCKVLFISSILIFLISSTESAINLVDLPLKLKASDNSVNLHATLTDVVGLAKYTIQEFISGSGPSIKGKILISSEKDSYNVLYNTSPNFKRDRLVIHGTSCELFSFKNNWDKTLPGVSKPVTNLILLMGPSILYRLGDSSLIWKEAPEKNIRGTMMDGATTEINGRLRITYYYKKKFKDDSGLKNPSRIEFSGYDPSSTSFKIKESLILDIYHQNENYYDLFANEVQPLPGIGCPNYLSITKKELPKLAARYIHYTMYETIHGATTTRTFSEIHASDNRKLLRLKTNLLGTVTEAIYDYSLGVSFIFQNGGKCNLLPGDLSAPGINDYGTFHLTYLLLVDQDQSDFHYLGTFNFEHRSGFPVQVWETTRYKANINGKMVDKAVITHYFIESQDNPIFGGYALVSTSIVLYKLDSSKKTYTLDTNITRDYINFEEVGFEDEFHDIFSLKECKYQSSQEGARGELTLGFKLQLRPVSGDSSYLTKFTERHIYQFKKDFLEYYIARQMISALRIDAIEYNFNDDQVEIDVKFLEIPNLESIFNKKKFMSVSEDTIKKLTKSKAISEHECIDIISETTASAVVVIYRPSDSLCGYLKSYDDLKEDTKVAQACSIYHFPLHNLHRLRSEIPLDQVQRVFMPDIGNSLDLFDGDDFKLYKLVDVIDKTKGQEPKNSNEEFFAEDAKKLIVDDQFTMAVPGVKNFADCYRNCRDSEQLACVTFSYCSNGDSVECRVSSLPDQELTEKNIEKDNKCGIYYLNVRTEYHEVHNRKFRTPTSIAMDRDLGSCAQYCYASPDCFSFQFCDFSCSFGGLYTDSATEYDGECSIFIPKVSQKYQKTGNKIVSEVMHTEMNLNLEQCASLCHGWSDGETGCKSFNYCPKSKTESSCSLTKFSVKSSDTVTTEGGDCSNYELKDESKGHNNKESSSTEVAKGTSGSGAFGIIMLFLFVGALLGFAAPIGYTKIKQLRNTSEINQSFSWTRQLDEKDEEAENVTKI